METQQPQPPTERGERKRQEKEDEAEELRVQDAEAPEAGAEAINAGDGR